MTLLQIGMEWFPEHTGGLNRYFRDVGQSLSDAGVSWRGLVVGTPAVAADSGGRVEAFAEAGAPLALRLWAARRSALRVVAKARPSLVVTHGFLYAWPSLDVFRAPHVAHFHGPAADEAATEGAPLWKARLVRAMERRVYRNAKGVVVLSEAFRELLCRDYGVESDRVVVVPGMIDETRFSVDIPREEARRKLQWKEKGTVLFCVRRLARRMGFFELLEAVARLPEVTLRIAGDGPLRAELEEKIRALGLGNRVFLLGRLDDSVLALAYAASDFSVVPSQQWEGFGLVAAESLACGTLPLVTPVGGLPEIVTGLDAGLVFADRSAEAISDGIRRALSRRDTLPTAAAARDYAQERFGRDPIGAKLRNVYARFDAGDEAKALT